MSAGVVHQSVGAGVGVVAAGISYFFYNTLNYHPLTPLYFLLCIPISVIYSLLPDLDIKSRGSVLFYFLILLIAGYFFYKEAYFVASVILIASIIPQFFVHRAVTHTIFFSLIFPLPVYFLFYKFEIRDFYFPMFYISALLGYLSHLALDA